MPGRAEWLFKRGHPRRGSRPGFNVVLYRTVRISAISFIGDGLIGERRAISNTIGQRETRRTSGNYKRLRILIGLELFTGIAAAVGGLLLVVDPDGSLLRAKMSALRDSPFSDWRIPGALLAILVGGGLLVTAACHLLRWRHASALSVFAGVGLVTFEAVELAWLSFQPLEVVFAVVGMVVATARVAERWLSRASCAAPGSSWPARTPPGRGRCAG